MTTILESTVWSQAALLTGLLVLAILSGHCAATLVRAGQWRKAGLAVPGAALAFLLLLLATAGLGDALPSNVRCFFLQPLAERMVCLPVAWGMALVLTALALTGLAAIQISRSGRNRLSRASVKECLDNLPTGLCFFAENGMLTLCNRTMYTLGQRLLGKELQTLPELSSAIDALPQDTTVLGNRGSSCRLLPDGSVWRFQSSVVRDQSGRAYTQMAACDWTELYQLTIQQEERSRELREMLKRLRRITENVAEITREQEILTAKMRVHNQMGACLLSARQYMEQGFRSEAKRPMLDVWTDTLAALREEIGQEDEEDALERLLAIADRLGVDVTLGGPLPEEKDTSYLLVAAMRECLTNMLRHAGGHALRVDLKRVDGRMHAEITNDGQKPSGEIAEGGGLSSLRTKIERAGGEMTVRSAPQFALQITLPDSAEGMKGE
jgi:hypothetical protein